jgi:ketosteroid isomerase-like protein
MVLDNERAMSRNDVEVIRGVLEDGLNLDPRLDSTWVRAAEWLHPDFVYLEDPALPGAGTHRGIAAFREAVTSYREVMGEMRFEMEGYFDAGDCVLVLINWWARGEHGAVAELPQAGIFTVRDGKVASWRVMFDREAAFRAVGLRPPAGERAQHHG